MPDTSFNLANLNLPGLLDGYSIPGGGPKSAATLTEEQLARLSPSQREAYLALDPKYQGYIKDVSDNGDLVYAMSNDYANSGLYSGLNEKYGLYGSNSAPLERFQEAYNSPLFQVLSPTQQQEAYKNFNHEQGGTGVGPTGPSIWSGLGRGLLTVGSVSGLGAGLGALAAPTAAGTGGAGAIGAAAPTAGGALGAGTGAGAGVLGPSVATLAPVTVAGSNAAGLGAGLTAGAIGAGVASALPGATSTQLDPVVVNGGFPAGVNPTDILAGLGAIGAGGAMNTGMPYNDGTGSGLASLGSILNYANTGLGLLGGLAGQQQGTSTYGGGGGGGTKQFRSIAPEVQLQSLRMRPNKTMQDYARYQGLLG